MKIVVATSNSGKLKEIQAFFKNFALTFVAQSTLNITNIEETGLSFVENAILKARHAATHSKLPALADDSGLMVDALQGAPGLYSARFAGTDASDQDNLAKLLDAIQTVPAQDRHAHFYCALALVRHAHDPTPLICTAQWQGKLLSAPQGEGGFGYDPIFFVPEFNCSAAELAPDLKNKLSHRGQALAELTRQFHLQYPRLYL